MDPREKADLRVIHNHPFCVLCGSHVGLTVERSPELVGQTGLTAVTTTAHEAGAAASRPRVVCGTCRANHEAWLRKVSGNP
jgi:hypothetical protein